MEEIKIKIIPILKRNDVVRAGLFGSVARDEDRPDSDLDLLIDFGESSKSLFDLVDLQDELENELNRKVDIVSYRYIDPYIRDQVLREEISIL
ncbi:MAG: nucleotidyltransferase family protein [Deltaproteobacteria bacterium]|nr:nucleotidyltransferase family protein [Deltaproteobacteria bacterium]